MKTHIVHLLLLCLLLKIFSLVSCEWIQIAQSFTKLNKTKANESSNKRLNGFDYSIYKDFFRVRKAEKNVIKCNKNIVENSSYKQPIENKVHVPFNNTRDESNRENIIVVKSNTLQKDAKLNITVKIVPTKSENNTMDIRRTEIYNNNILAFFTSVQQYFGKNAAHGILYKIKLLKKIEDKMLRSIGKITWNTLL